MVDLEHLNSIQLVSLPIGQNILARLLLAPNYHLFAKVDIRVENVENIPRDETVIFAMNHTDRYNYWPFQYKLWRLKFPYTTVWVKGKYYRSQALGKVLDWCNLIPVPSMGYLVEEFYKKTFKKKIDREQYRAVKDIIDGIYEKPEHHPKLSTETTMLLKDNFIDFIRKYHEQLMEKVAELSGKALCEKGLNLIIFPEGTRSLKLAEGRTGIAQLALHTGKKIVPVGCNNSEEVYSGTLPFAKSGTITYRVGKPLSPDGELKEFRIPEPFKLFSKESQKKYKEQFEGVTKLVMESIHNILDEKYRK